ncbi:FlgE Flagellar hook protein FlgE [Burkholderiaceae bacterium]
MSFFTALTGLNAATAQLGVTANNIANAGTIGFKRSRTDFGDIFATSPLQKASSTVGQGVSLKRVTQEFSQGNVSFSSNTLDLAITGDGFFPLKSADGFQDIYTRNGAFMMNDQYNVVNSAGQRLMAASVDSSGKANLNDQNVLSIPQKTTGQARETSLVQLGLNFPADAKVINTDFNRNDPNTYNKSTALTVYDKGGNGYLATVYYVKTQNASASQPTNKWQTYVYIGDSLVQASLQQSTNNLGEKQYVNKYGEIKPESEVSDLLVNAKTKMFSLNQLTDVRDSVPAAVSGAKVGSYFKTADDPHDFTGLSAKDKASLTKFVRVSVDGSNALDLDMSSLEGQSLTGAQIATKLTNELNKQFGDQRYWNMTNATSSEPIVLMFGVNDQGTAQNELTLDLSKTALYPVGQKLEELTTEQVVAALQKEVDAQVVTANAANAAFNLTKSATTAAKTAIDAITVSYDEATRGFKFKQLGTAESAQKTIAIRATTNNNEVLGLSTAATTLDATGGYGSYVGANGNFIRPASQQRFGLKVEFDSVKQTFSIASGTTGDTSTIKLEVPQTYVDSTATKVTEKANLTFNAMATGQSMTVGGLTFTATSNLAGPAVAAAFASLANNANTKAGITGGTYSGALSGWASGAVTGSTVTFTSTTTETNVEDIVVGGSAPPPTIAVTQGDSGVRFWSDLTKAQQATLTAAGVIPSEGHAGTLLGFSVAAEVITKPEAIRGVPSGQAVVTGSPVTINVNNNFVVDATNNKFVVAVDDVKGTVELPFGSTYTLDSFKAELEKRINQLANTAGSTVNGVKVDFDRSKGAFTFKSGTATSNSFIKVSGATTWGLANIDAGRGSTSTWIKPTQFTEEMDGVPVAKYIDEFGRETNSADGFSALPEWSPIYLDKGELTFNTGGNLISPKAGSQLDTVYLADGKGALTINIDYSKSTQFSSPYAVLSQSQDGAPEGDLVGVSIGDDGLVNASYSNGTQNSLGKVVLVNFSNPSGLRQIGDSSYYASSQSGKAKVGEAGSAGFGTVRSGATERANVDLTQELVDLITAQRNFQASAKAIETSTTLTQAIIQIRA